MGNEDTVEEDQIEWVSGSYPSSPSPSFQKSRRIVRHTNALEIPLRQIHFNSSTSQCLSAPAEGSMALFLNDKTEVSICLNNMKDEISFGIKEVEEFRITRDNSIIFRLRPGFERAYYFHPKGYSFKGKRYQRDVDPTGGKLGGISCINVKSNYNIDREEYNLIDGWIKKMINRSRGTNNQVEGRGTRNNSDFTYNSRPFNRENSDRAPLSTSRIQNGPSRSYANSNDPPQNILPGSRGNAIKKRELYVTCVYPTQKRAIIYSADGIFSHFQFHIKQRFGWKWERMWYRNKTGGWNLLNNEGIWASIKKQAMSKPIPRIEVYMR